MLLTRCPECDTTFRVTDETLKKASGQVRCGRCATVFNAYAELQEAGGKRLEGEGARDEAQKPAAAAQPPEEPKPAATTEAHPEEAPDSSAISATEVERVLTDDTAEPVPYVWLRPEPPPRSRWWTVAAALALVTLGAQTLHHFRSTIASHPTFGPWLTTTYKLFGAEITPNWNVHQYEIIDWVATAEPNSRGLGSLKITARIQNRGPQQQPYPAVQLRLKDRYETAVGSRMFAPAEYLPHDTPHGPLMLPGETARAEIEVVDPGPDAYGFELDVCIEVEASLVTCRNDEVFL
jgi:predicted Zn finger-like uncharacterized protein